MGSQFGVGFVIGATLSSSVASAFASVESKIKKTQKAYRDASRESSKLQKALELRKQRDDLSAKVRASGGLDAVAIKDLAKISKKYREAKTAASAYKVAVKDWAVKQAEAARQVELTQKNLQRLNALQSESARRQELRGKMVQAVAPVASIAIPAKLAIDFESSMADVKKVTNFDDAGFKVFSKDILDMSTRLPIAASGLAQIASAAGAAGIAEADLRPFVEDAAKMGVAFDISAEQAGAAMTGLRNNFKLNQDEVRLLGDAMNALANNMDAKAGQIVDFANRTGGTARIYGFTGNEVAALGAAFLDAKVGAEEASTATNAMMVNLGTADKLPKSAQKTLASLGLSGTALARAFKKDAQGSLLAFLNIVNQSKDPMSVLADVFGKEHAPKIAKLMNNMDRYGMALDTATDKSKYAGSTEKEYAARAETTANNIQLLMNKTARLGITIGNTLLPPINKAIEFIGPLIDKTTAFAERNEGLVKVVTGVAAGFVALKVGGLAASYGFSMAKSGVLNLMGVAQGVGTVLANTGGGLLKLFSVFGNGAKAFARAYTMTWTQALAPVKSGFVSFKGHVASLKNSFSTLRGSLSSLRARFSGLRSGASGAAGGVRRVGAASMFTAARIGVMDAASRLGHGGMKLLGSGIRGVGRAFRIALGPMNLLMTALSFGVDYVIEHWDTIGPYFTRLWEGVKTVFDKALKWMQPIFDKVGKAFEQLGKAWDYLFGGDEQTVSVKTVAEKAEEQAGERQPTTSSAPVKPVVGPVQPVAQQAAVQPIAAPQSEFDGEMPDFYGEEEADIVSEALARQERSTRAVQPVVQVQPVAPVQPVSQVKPVAPIQAVAPVWPVVQQAAVRPAPPTQSDFLSQLSQKNQVRGVPSDGEKESDGPSVSVSFDFAINGAPDRQFADGVVRAVRERRSDLERIISDLVHDQMRLAYGS